MRTVVLIAAAFVMFVLGVPPVHADDYASREEMEQMRREMQDLKSLVGELKGIIIRQNETINELQKHKTIEEYRNNEHSGRPENAATAEHDHDGAVHEDEGDLDMHDIITAIKPSISLTGDFLARLGDDHHVSSHDDRFDLRGVDLIFSGTVDGVGKAVFTIAYHEDDVVLEEGFFIAEKLLPFHTYLKLGKFRVDYGLLNTVHPHALPQVDYPLIYRSYLGHEGYIDEGIGISGRFPSPWKQPFHYSLQVLNGNRHSHGDDHVHLHAYETGRMKDYDDLVYVGRLHNTLRPFNAFTLLWGLSGLTGKFEDEDASPRFIYGGGDLTLLWHPFGDGHKRIRWQSEVVSAQIEDETSWERSWGMYSFLDYQLLPDLLIGARYDYAEYPLESSYHSTAYTGYLTYDYSHSNRLRLQFSSLQRNRDKDINRLFVQWIFTLGRHEHTEEHQR